MKKMLSKIRRPKSRKAKEEDKAAAAEGVRITNDTVAEHREEVLSQLYRLCLSPVFSDGLG